MKVYPREGARVMDPRTMRAVKDGDSVNLRGFETYWYRQEKAGDVFETAETRDKAAAQEKAVKPAEPKKKSGGK